MKNDMGYEYNSLSNFKKCFLTYQFFFVLNMNVSVKFFFKKIIYFWNEMYVNTPNFMLILGKVHFLFSLRRTACDSFIIVFIKTWCWCAFIRFVEW